MTATTPTDPTLDEHTATDVAQLARLNDEIADRSKTVDEIKARLREHLRPGRWTYGGRDILNIADPVLAFDAKKAAAVIPAELHPACSIPKLDGAAAKRVLPAHLYEQCLTPKAAAVKAL